MARRPFSSQSLVLIVIAIAINMIGGQLISMLKLPIFLDSIGTLISAVLLGPFIGMLTGLLTNLLWGVAYRPYRCRVCSGSDGYRSGRRVAGARRLVSYPAQSDRQRGRHYVGGDAGRRTASYRAFWRRYR